jgi:outer membrane protein TolC
VLGRTTAAAGRCARRLSASSRQVVAETANTEWWKQFGDPVLDQLIATALANNLNVKVAAANVEQAAGVFTQTRSGLYPQIGYAGTAERVRVTETGATPFINGIPNPRCLRRAADRKLGDRSLGRIRA